MRRYNPDYYSYEETTRPIRPRTPRTSKPTNSRNPYTQRIVPEAEVEPIIYTQVPCAKSPKFFYGYPTTTTDYGKNLRVNDIEEASSSNPDSCMYVPVVCVPQPVIKAEEYVPEENMKYYYGEKHRIAKRKQHIPMQQPYIGYEDQEAPSYYYYYKSNYYDQPGYYNQELVDVQPSQRSPNGYYYYNDHFGRKPSSILQVPYKNYSRKPARIYVKDPTKTDLPIKQKTANTKTRGNQVRKKMTCASQTMVTDDILERIEGKCPEKMECRSTQTTKSEEQACFITNGTQTKFGKPKTGLFSCYQKANKVNNDNYDTPY